MHATLPCPATRSAADRFTILVDGAACAVRAARVWTIEEVLEFEQQFDGDLSDMQPGDAGLVADVLDSRMIAPPRSRHRRQRPLSSRAVFYSSGRD